MKIPLPRGAAGWWDRPSEGAAQNIARRWWGRTHTVVPWADSLFVVEVGAWPPSLHYRPYAETLDGTSVLAWMIHRVREMLGAPRPAVLAYASEMEHVRLALRGHDVVLHPMTARGKATDLCDLASSTRSRRVLLVDPTAGVLPRSIWEHLWTEHATASRHATLLEGTPCALAPLLVEVDWLTAVAMRNRGQPQDPRRAVRAWLNTKHAPPARWAVKVGAVRSHHGVEATSRRWPYRVRLELPPDVEDLREAVYKAGEWSGRDREGSDLLPAWARAHARRAASACGSSQAQRRTEHASRGGPDGPVLYAQVPAAFAGCEQVVVTLAERVVQRRRPHGCRALVPLPGTFSERLEQAGVLVEIANRDLAEPTSAHFAYCRRILQRFKPALVHAHGVVGVPLTFALVERGVPLIQHVHVADERLLLALEDQVLTASRVIAVSKFVRRLVLRLGVDPARVHLIYNGISLRRVPEESRLSARRSMRRELGLSDRAELILLPARFAPNKRQDIAMQTTAVLAARSPDAHLLLVGEAHHPHQSLPDVLRREAARRNLSRRVHFLGFHEDMDRLYAAADVLLLPSEDDPIPLVVLEAMAVGVPVVAGRSGGIPEMVEHGKSGLLVEPGDVNGFADALRQVLSERELRDHLTRGGRERVETHFSLRRFVDEVLAVYDEALGSCGDR